MLLYTRTATRLSIVSAILCITQLQFLSAFVVFPLVFTEVAPNHHGHNPPSFFVAGKRNGPTSSLATTFDDTLTTTDISTTAAVGAQRLPLNTQRRVRRLEKFARLPVWPVWHGVFIWAIGQVFGNEVAARLENTITGRVCPNFFEYTETSPFIMLVHHCHSFSPIDPLRYLQKTFFPEGFPAHPHRGFVTLTYFISGGFTHRDSIGIQQTYGTMHEKHSQWLYTGSGLLHEEMFDNRRKSSSSPFQWLQPIRHELYQLWINVPARDKMGEPCSELLGGNNDTPAVVRMDNEKNQLQSTTTILAGSFANEAAVAPTKSGMSILHVQIQPGANWKFQVPKPYETLVLYMRQGSCLCTSDEMYIPVHHTAFFTPTGEQLVLENPSTVEVSDFLLLAGTPIREPCVAQGSMVMNTADEINQAYSDYQKGLFGLPWDHSLSDDEWKQHVTATTRLR